MVIVVVMGVCGSGKTTVGLRLSKKLRCEFADADQFHSSCNKEKMSQGIPLTDEDRMPWLLSIRQFIQGKISSNTWAVVTCSGLKRSYRDTLAGKDPCSSGSSPFDKDSCTPVTGNRVTEVLFVYLKGREKLLRERMEQRNSHFMPVELLSSQLRTLEEPSADESHIVVDISVDVDTLVEDLFSKIKLHHNRS